MNNEWRAVPYVVISRTIAHCIKPEHDHVHATLVEAGIEDPKLKIMIIDWIDRVAQDDVGRYMILDDHWIPDPDPTPEDPVPPRQVLHLTLLLID